MSELEPTRTNSNLTATDELLVTGYPNSLRPELHKALKARGIDYWVAQGLTFWDCPDGRECVAYGYQADGKPKLAVKIVGITDPEQAIAATLGATDANPTQAESSGTCHITDNGPWGYPYVCSACGASFDPDVNNGEFNYCPNCGRRCVW